VSTDASTVNKWCAGTRLQPVYHLITICEQSGCTLDFLYRGKLGGLMRRDVELHLVAAYPELLAESPLEVAEPRALDRPSTAKAPTS
jgi:hypothetical protein